MTPAHRSTVLARVSSAEVLPAEVPPADLSTPWLRVDGVLGEPPHVGP